MEGNEKSLWWMPVAGIVVLALVAVTAVIYYYSPGKEKEVVFKLGLNDTDERGCYKPVGLAWCAPNQRCQTAADACSKRDVTEQMCNTYVQASLASNMTGVVYEFSEGRCEMTEVNFTKTFDLHCENEEIKADLRINAFNSTAEELGVVFSGCNITEVV